MKNVMTLAGAVLALTISVNSASAQISGGGGGTIGCDPSNAGSVRATNCSVFFKEKLYGPSANPYASAWDNGEAKPVVKHRKKAAHPSKTSKTNKTSKKTTSTVN